MLDLQLTVGQKMFWNAIHSKNMVKISSKLHFNAVVEANKHASFESACAESMISTELDSYFNRFVSQDFKSARTDDVGFISNVRALADASSCKAANKSSQKHITLNQVICFWSTIQLKLQPRSRNRETVESLIDKPAWLENSRMLTKRSWRVPILMTQLPLR